MAAENILSIQIEIACALQPGGYRVFFLRHFRTQLRNYLFHFLSLPEISPCNKGSAIAKKRLVAGVALPQAPTVNINSAATGVSQEFE